MYHRISVHWTDMRLAFPGRRGTLLGVTCAPRDYSCQRIMVKLASNLDWLRSPRGQFIGVLLHEMLHAYFMVWCRGCQGLEPDDGGGHGPTFWRACRRIEAGMDMDLFLGPGRRYNCQHRT